MLSIGPKTSERCVWQEVFFFQKPTVRKKHGDGPGIPYWSYNPFTNLFNNFLGHLQVRPGILATNEGLKGLLTLVFQNPPTTLWGSLWNL